MISECFSRLPVNVLQVHFLLKELVRRSISETQVCYKILPIIFESKCTTFFNGEALTVQELKRFPTLQAEIAAAANAALERFREDSKKTTLRLVDMESSYLTVDFFRRLPQELEKGGNPGVSAADRYSEGHYRRIASNVLSYIGDGF